MAENTTQSLYLKQIMLTMYSPLVKGGLGLFNLDLPPPPPADWLPGELARFSSLHLQAHHAEPMGADSNFLRQAIDQMCTNRSPTFNHELLNIYLDHSTIRKAKWCGFCRNNGEMPQIYCSHSLRMASKEELLDSELEEEAVLEDKGFHSLNNNFCSAFGGD
ncbi:uncharacterized protein [Panulirus ornatus]|uniref:uncharacterized protein isoform X2 n=1 Tax=Panulirus ornatus TaxID=150431 RepID=UPI003A89F9C3